MKKRFLGKIFAATVAMTCAVNVSVISNFVTAATNLTYEFEDGTLSGATAMAADKDGNPVEHSGDGLVFLEDGGETASVTATVETTGMYQLTLSTYTPYGAKTHNLLINGVDQGQIAFVENKAGFVETDLGMFKLNAGENTITVKSSWGWTYLDYIKVADASLPELKASKTLSDSKATDSTKRLMSYLADNYGEHILSGQQEIYKYGPHDFEYEFEYIKNLTGEYPAIRAFDYLNECNILYGSEDGTTDRMIDWANNKNGIITASWHVTVPKDFTNYNVGDRVDYSQATYAVKNNDGSPATNFDTANAIIEGTKEYDYYMACLKTLAESLQKLQDQNIPIILRPLHEAEGGGGETGSWFWWGQDGSAVYKDLWKLTYKTLTEEYDLHNIIWEWNSYAYATSTNWYPGDEYVDLIAYDKYNCTDWSTGQAVLQHNDSAISGTFYNLVDMYGGKKMVAMSENDSIPTLDNITSEKAGWLYFCPWYDGGSDSINFLSNPIFNKAEDLIKMYQSDYCITLAEVPADIYSTYPIEGTEPTTTEPTTEVTTEPVTTELTTIVSTTIVDPTETTTEAVTTTEATTTTEAVTTTDVTTTSNTGTATTTDITTSEPVTATTEATNVTIPEYTGDPSQLMFGDVNLSNNVDTSDIVALNKYLVNAELYALKNDDGYRAYKQADCKYDDKLNQEDSMAIINYCLQKIGIKDLGMPISE